MIRRIFLSVGLLLAGFQVNPAFACGEMETPCEIELGSYHLALPKTSPPSDGFPALLHFHGAGGSGPSVLNNKAMVETLTERGFAIIAPNGLKRPNSRFGPGWSFRPEGVQQRDELAFTKAVIADAAKRQQIDPTQVTLSGYSIGGSLVWYLACKDPAVASSYAPYAGGFWRPHPVDCAGPVKLLHTHGWRDQTVPLEGRPLRNGQIYQGDILEGFQVWRRENRCDRLRADEFKTDGPFWRRMYTSCAPGTALEFALHPGGHERPGAAWATMIADWLEGLDG